MIYTEFDPLEEIIVGDIYAPGDLDNLLPKKSLAGFNKILEETKEDLDKFAQFLESGGVTVRRPNVKIFQQDYAMPEFDIKLPMAPIVPRDAYLVRGTNVFQTYTGLTDRYFDSLAYYDIFNKLFDEGYNWIAQPLPMLKNLHEWNDKWYFDSEVYHTKLKDRVLWHTATMFQAGDAVIVNTRGPGSAKGLEWMKRNLPNTRFINNPGTVMKNFGHIDHGFIMIDDDTVIHAGLQWVPEVLRTKKLIDCSPYLNDIKWDNFVADATKTKSKYDVEWIDKYLENWLGYNQEVCFDLNVVIIDSKNIVWGKNNPELFAFLKREHNIDSHVCFARHFLYWEGGLHCQTLDVKRKGLCRQII